MVIMGCQSPATMSCYHCSKESHQHKAIINREVMALQAGSRKTTRIALAGSGQGPFTPAPCFNSDQSNASGKLAKVRLEDLERPFFSSGIYKLPADRDSPNLSGLIFIKSPGSTLQKQIACINAELYGH